MKMLNLQKARLRVLVIAAMASLHPAMNVLANAGNANEAQQSQSANSGQFQETISSSKDIFDFDFFKSKVEPIFLKQRPGHARCYACHSDPNRVFHLERLSDGVKEWTEEQSRRNFLTITRLVAPGDPLSSLLLIHPLAPEAGGDAFHSGGRQFETQNDPDWLTIADWVRGAHTASHRKSKSGSFIYVTNSAGAAVDVVDTSSLALAKTIPINRSIHNIYVTPDGKYAVAGSIESKSATVMDLQTEQVAWEVKFDNGVRPMAFDTNPDGSTKHIFVQLSNLNGFAVVDFAKHVEVARVKFPDQPGGYGDAEVRFNTPSHGIGVARNGKSLWVGSTIANAVFAYSLPDLKLDGYCLLPNVYPPNHAPTGSVPEWITFTPDSSVVYISNSAAASVSAIDARTRKLTAVIPVGEVPKRMNTLILP